MTAARRRAHVSRVFADTLTGGISLPTGRAILLGMMLSGGILGTGVGARPGVITLGSNLSRGQQQTMLAYFQAPPSTPVIWVDNGQEHRLLGGIAPSKEIGTRSISCAYVIGEGDHYGIRVSTHNITWVTPAMYANALATAGVTNAKVMTAAPFPVSGTAALTGILLAYQKAKGMTLDYSQQRTAAREMVVTGQLGQAIHNPAGAAELILVVKQDVVQHGLNTPSAIRPVVIHEANRLRLHLNDSQIRQITLLMTDISHLSLNAGTLSYQLQGVKRQLQGEEPGVWARFMAWLHALWQRLAKMVHISWIDGRRLLQ